MMVCIVIAMDGSIDSRQFTMLIQGTQGKQEILDILYGHSSLLFKEAKNLLFYIYRNRITINSDIIDFIEDHEFFINKGVKWQNIFTGIISAGIRHSPNERFFTFIKVNFVVKIPRIDFPCFSFQPGML